MWLRLKNNQSLSKTEYLLQLKTEYSALKVNDDFERKKLELELKLWNLLTQMSNDEMLELSEDDRNWSKSFIETKKNELFFQVSQYHQHPSYTDISDLGLQRVVGVMEGFLKHIGEQYDNVVSNGLCADCHGTLTPEQINQYLANQRITCEHCNASLKAKSEFLGNLIHRIHMDHGGTLIHIKERDIDSNKIERFKYWILKFISFQPRINPDDASILDDLRREVDLPVVKKWFNIRLFENPEDGWFETDIEGRVISINLSDKSISVLPESIGQLKKLKSLNLSNNQLLSIPEFIGQLTNLEYLMLNGNVITSVPDSLGQLTKLKTLGLGYNQLAEIPEVIGQLPKLEYLYLEENQLKSSTSASLH